MENIEIKNSPVKGLRLLRSAGILSIIAIITTIVGGVTLVIASSVGIGLASSSGTTTIPAGAVAVAGVGGLLAMIGGILTIVACIMQIVGLVKNSGTNAGYKNALMLVALELIISVVVSFAPLPAMVAKIISIASTFVAFFVVYFVINATNEFLLAKGNSAVADQGKSVRKLYMICTAVIAVTEIVAFIPMMATITSTISMVASVVELVAVFKYLGFLGKSVTALQG